MKWEILDTTLCYQGFFRVDKFRLRHSLYSGGQSDVLVRELVQHSNAVAVLPYDPATDRVVLIEQFRTGAIGGPMGPWLLEIVAGLIDPGERAEIAAVRETREETGCDPSALHHVYDYYSTPGGFRERVSLYIARVDAGRASGIHGQIEEGEDICIRVVGVDEAIGMMESGLITSAQPIVALQWLAMNRGKLRADWAGKG
ncbi:MAG: NUDIX domain-containing protein [Pseudomonadota bacterium]|nr:NUDIX domain-containing protein [Pseudomonadota bacterium]